MASWREPPALKQLVKEVNELWPNRNKRSDGSIGDPSHAARKSDHNPDPNDPERDINARDITHDPASGADMHRVREAIHRDPRVAYLIFDGFIFNPSRDRKLPGRVYNGRNQHKTHLHVSISHSESLEESTAPWLSAITQKEDDLAQVSQDEWQQVKNDIAAIKGAVFKGRGRDDPKYAKGPIEIDELLLVAITSAKEELLAELRKAHA